jgi:hypothetical protein
MTLGALSVTPCHVLSFRSVSPYGACVSTYGVSHRSRSLHVTQNTLDFRARTLRSWTMQNFSVWKRSGSWRWGTLRRTRSATRQLGGDVGFHCGPGKMKNARGALSRACVSPIRQRAFRVNRRFAPSALLVNIWFLGLAQFGPGARRMKHLDRFGQPCLVGVRPERADNLLYGSVMESRRFQLISSTLSRRGASV